MVFTSKIFEKQLWKSDILSKDAAHRPASVLEISLFHRCFSNILLVKTIYISGALIENGLNMCFRNTIAIIEDNPNSKLYGKRYLLR